jgi:hypothetical protein
MIAPPEGMSEADYAAIEAAVMETVRGRWFLAEFARRGRVDEMRQMLDAIGKLEQVVREQQGAPVDPSIRLLVQRLKEVARGLERTGAEMRQRGLEERYCVEIEMQARAVSGLLRLNQTSPATAPQPPSALPEPVPEPRQPPAASEPIPELALKSVSTPSPESGRAASARLDRLPIAEKLALFA